MHPAVVGHRVTVDSLNAATGADAVEDDPDSPVEAFEQSMLTIKIPQTNNRGSSAQGTHGNPALNTSVSLLDCCRSDFRDSVRSCRLL